MEKTSKNSKKASQVRNFQTDKAKLSIEMAKGSPNFLNPFKKKLIKYVYF